MTRDAASGTGKPRPVRVQAEAKPKPETKRTPRISAAPAKKNILDDWLDDHSYSEEAVRSHDTELVCEVPDFRLPGTPGKAINASFPDIAAKLAAGGIDVRLLCRLPECLHPKGFSGSRFHVLCDDLPLKELVRAFGIGQAELERESGLSPTEIAISLKAPARLPRLRAIAEAIDVRIEFLVTRPRHEPVIHSRLELLDMRAPPTSGCAAVLWPGAELASRLSAQGFTRSVRLSAEMLGLADDGDWRPETLCGVDRAIRPLGAELLIAVLDHRAGWLLSNHQMSSQTLPALIGSGPDLAGRLLPSLPLPEDLGLAAMNAALNRCGITHRFLLRDIKSGSVEIFDDGPVATASQFRELARRRAQCDPA
ncbi:helix-turn-helix domain-containing protein [Paracoccus sp. ME4]|uniref:helix-turn-helix domain-containing protein n=1 Tax=Paracoccus sp. ME4 TaxID=3138066 RepID=UPI00398B14EC